jgi:hypothetical protein
MGFDTGIAEGLPKLQTPAMRFRDGDESLLTEHDVMVVTAISHSLGDGPLAPVAVCAHRQGYLVGPASGAPQFSNSTRVVKWHIGYTYPSLSYYVDTLHDQICDTNYLANVFGCPAHAVLRAPPMPAAYAAAANFRAAPRVKERLVLLDNDFKFDMTRIRVDAEFIVLDGMPQEKLFECSIFSFIGL